MMTRVLFFLVCCVALVVATHSPATAEQELSIGSSAPALDIEHWIQDGNGFFKPVKKFKKGNVYVVEFWATWCGPCIMSMPHLAELQNKYRGRGVQIISVSDETVDEVKDLMGQEHPQVEKTFGDITAAYSLTTDPDRSVHTDYMEASNQQGIPTSFIVGKTSQIEWIGHPMEMDEPLEAVVTDSWDREKFRKTYEAKAEFEEAMQKLSMLAGAGKFDKAIEFAEAELAKAKKNELDEMAIQWNDIRYSLRVSSGNVDDDTVAYYRKHIQEMKGDPINLGRFGYSLYDAYQQGGDLGPLATEAIKALLPEIDDAPEDAQAFLYNTVAQLYAADKQYKKAIGAQEKAIDAADARQKRRLQPFLDELMEKVAPKKKAADKEQTPDKDDDADSQDD
ncbi:MAG: TlpA family protein disulfide reductase [Pirellulaceae bacterium]|nr:TlpA family protein disulfide reductase [Pirellulaceae bacterium]